MGAACSPPEDVWAEEEEYELVEEEQQELLAEDDDEQNQQVFTLPAKKRKTSPAVQTQNPGRTQAPAVRVKGKIQLASALAGYTLQKLPSLEEQLVAVYRSVSEADSVPESILPLQSLPPKVELVQRNFPEPLKSCPFVAPPGKVNMLNEQGKLPDMAKSMPSEAELRSWTWESQQAFWNQSACHMLPPPPRS